MSAACFALCLSQLLHIYMSLSAVRVPLCNNFLVLRQPCGVSSIPVFNLTVTIVWVTVLFISSSCSGFYVNDGQRQAGAADCLSPRWAPEIRQQAASTPGVPYRGKNSYSFCPSKVCGIDCDWLFTQRWLAFILSKQLCKTKIMIKQNYEVKPHIILLKVFTHPSKYINSGVPITSMTTGV